MPTNRFPIVGMFHRPPAQAIVNVLSIGTPLFLLAEPENEHDINAIAVRILTKDISDAALGQLEETLPPVGYSTDSLFQQDEWHLGYIPRNFAAKLRGENIVPLDEKVAVTFGTNAEGAPRVIFDREVL